MLQGKIIHVQVVMSWTAEDGSSVLRVVTRQMQTSVNRAAALRGVNCEVSVLLLAKRVIQEARSRQAASHAKETDKLRQAIGVMPQLYPICSSWIALASVFCSLI